MSRCSYVIAAFLLFGLLCEHMVSSGAQIQQDKICGKEVSWAVFKMGLLHSGPCKSCTLIETIYVPNCLGQGGGIATAVYTL